MEAVENSGAELPSNVMAPLTPGEAWAREARIPYVGIAGTNAKFGKPLSSTIRQRIHIRLTAHEQLAFFQSVRNLHSHLSCEMRITGARVAEGPWHRCSGPLGHRVVSIA